MTPAIGFEIVFKCSTIVKYPAIIGEKYLPRVQAELYPEIWTMQQRFHNAQGFLLVWGQRLTRPLVTDLDVVV